MAEDRQKSPDEKIGEATLAPVVSGKVIVKEKSEGKKLLETFFKGNIEAVRKGVWEDVIVPTVMDMLWSGLERAGRGLIYGDDDRSRRSRDRDRDSVRATRVDFTSYSSKRDRDRDRDTYADRNDVYDYGEVRFEYDRGPDGRRREDARRDAERVLAEMERTIEDRHWISVAQMFDLCRMPRRYTDCEWGWRDIRSATIGTGHGCYILKLPRPEPRD